MHRTAQGVLNLLKDRWERTTLTQAVRVAIQPLKNPPRKSNLPLVWYTWRLLHRTQIRLLRTFACEPLALMRQTLTYNFTTTQ